MEEEFKVYFLSERLVEALDAPRKVWQALFTARATGELLLAYYGQLKGEGQRVSLWLEIGTDSTDPTGYVLFTPRLDALGPREGWLDHFGMPWRVGEEDFKKFGWEQVRHALPPGLVIKEHRMPGDPRVICTVDFP